MQELKDTIFRVMTEYLQSVINGEEAKAKKEKREPNPNLKSTIFLWIKYNITLDAQSTEELITPALTELVQEGKVIHHPVHTACYYLPLNTL